MKALVVYDTKWGNTEKVAAAVAAGIGKGAQALRVDAVAPDAAGNLDLLVLGSPVLGGKPTKPMQAFLKAIVRTSGTGLRIAVFDTRMKMKFAEKFGFAADKMADQLRGQENTVISEPMGFLVTGQKGPLAEGEEERAAQWGRELLQSKG